MAISKNNQIFFSCLPALSNESPIGIAYTWYVWVAGGLIPSAIILISNLFIVYELHKASIVIEFTTVTQIIFS